MYAVNNNSGYLNGDPSDYLYLDIDDAKAGVIEWLTYDQMREQASGIKYDCFTDETCYGYNWDYDMEHYIPALKEYATAKFYNNNIGETDYYGAFKQYCSYGEYPNFEDDEWWELDNQIIQEGEDRYHYKDDVVLSEEFQAGLVDALLQDDELEEISQQAGYSFDEFCNMLAADVCSGEYLPLLRDGGMTSYYVVYVDTSKYLVDADLVWDIARSYEG